MPAAQSLIAHRGPTSSRGPLSIAAILLAAGLARPAAAQNWHWNSGSGDWSEAVRWLPLGLPAPTASVFIGSTDAAENATVTLDMTASIATLVITDGMRLNTDSRYLQVAGDTVVSGRNVVGPVLYSSTLRLGPRDGQSFSTRDLTLVDGGRLYLDGGLGQINRALSVGADSSIYGDGIIGLAGPGSTLVNDGLIQAGTDGGLILQQYGGGRYDLDGLTGTGRVHMATYNPVAQRGTALRLDGAGLSDSFSSELSMGPGSDLFMNLAEGWTVDASGEVRMVGLSGGEGRAGRIRGGELNFAGLLRVSGSAGSPGWLDVESSRITFNTQARVQLTADARLNAGGPATTGVRINGGTFDIAEGAVLRFQAPTEMRGGEFTTTTVFPAGGRVEFNGPTTWNGEVTLNGYAIQSGDAATGGPTVINAGRFVMTETPLTTWSITHPLVIAAESIGTTGGNAVRGNLEIGGGFFGRLTVNLPDPGDYWVTTGRMTLTGDDAIHITRIAGSEYHNVGELVVTGGRAQITSDAWLLGGSVDLGPATASLRMTGTTRVSGLTEFTGHGTLRNAGHMTLSLGADLDQVGLTNEGLLDLGATDIGAAAVDRLLCTDSATWAVDIGGPLAGTDHDLLIVSGESAMLAGRLEVRLIDAGGGLFLPNVGDEFTILTALGWIGGSFLADPVTLLDGRMYEWSVRYEPHNVILRLENIVPAPGGVALAIAATVIAARRRRA